MEIQRALMSLAEEFRMAIYYADVEGYTYAEIAEIMDIPRGTVMSRLHRGRTRLRELLLALATERGALRRTTWANAARGTPCKHTQCPHRAAGSPDVEQELRENRRHSARSAAINRRRPEYTSAANLRFLPLRAGFGHITQEA
ncbi:MAG TPA: sigma factor-like helix-turn-helix DNA-binding protein [Jatrophihabitans sp.]